MQGGNPVQRPDQLLQALSRAGSGPAPQSQVFIGRLVVVFGTGKGTGIFFYSGTPALGNPPILAITTASSDPYGNPVTASAITDSGMPLLIYSGPPAAGNLILSLAPAAGTDSFGNSFPEGLNVTQGVISGSVVNATTITVNPGPFLLYGNQNTTAFVFTSIGTFTPTSSGTVSVGFIGQGGAGNTSGGAGGGEFAFDTDTVTGSTPYTITLDSTSTRATFNTKTVTAHAGGVATPGVGGAGGTGSTNATHFNGGNGKAGAFQAGGGGAGGGSAGGNAFGSGFAGNGGSAGGLFPAGGNGGSSAGNGHAPGGGGAQNASGSTGGAGIAVIYFTGTGGSTQLLASVAGGAGTDPVLGGAYNAGVWDYNPTFASASGLINGGLQMTTPTATANIGQSGGYPTALGPDGITYDMTRILAEASGQTVNAVAFAPVTGIGGIPLKAISYRIRGAIFALPAAAAGAGELQFVASGGLVASSINIQITELKMPLGGGAVTLGNGQLIQAFGATYTSATFVAGLPQSKWWIDGRIVVSTAGTLTPEVACTIAADTYQVNVGSYIEVLPELGTL